MSKRSRRRTRQAHRRAVAQLEKKYGAVVASNMQGWAAAPDARARLAAADEVLMALAAEIDHADRLAPIETAIIWVVILAAMILVFAAGWQIGKRTQAGRNHQVTLLQDNYAHGRYADELAEGGE